MAKLLTIDNTSLLLASDIKISFSRLSCKRTAKDIKNIIERVQTKFNDQQDNKNYIQDFLVLIDNNISMIQQAKTFQKIYAKLELEN